MAIEAAADRGDQQVCNPLPTSGQVGPAAPAFCG